MTDETGSAVVVVPHAIVGDLRKADITVSNRLSTVGEVLAWQPTDTWREVLGGPLAPAVVFKDGALLIIGLPALAGNKLEKVLKSKLGTDDVSVVLTDATGFNAAMSAIGFEVGASDLAVPLLLGKSEHVLEPHWRDDVPEPVQDDLDRLLDEILRLGRQLLERDGELQAFALSLNLNDDIDVDFSTDKAVDEDALVNTLFGLVNGERSKHRAFAIIQNIVTDNFTALSVWLEHRDGPAFICVNPYKKPRFRGGYKFKDDDTTVIAEEHRVWIPQQDAVANDDERAVKIVTFDNTPSLFRRRLGMEAIIDLMSSPRGAT